MKTVQLGGGQALPALGLGTWRLGESKRIRAAEVAAVRRAFELGYRIVDTAEMYGEGGAEEVVGQALDEAMRAGTISREQVFIVSKVYPQNASHAGMLAACERSRKRLRLESIDLYLLHWRGSHSLEDTVGGFEALQTHDRIGRWGVSNFDLDDMVELWRVDGGRECATNQVYYSITERGPEFTLLPWLRAHNIAAMAYSPIDQGRLASDPRLSALALGRGVSTAQMGLAWVMGRTGVMAIPKAVREVHLRENLEAAELELTVDELAELDRIFPPPRRKSPLEMR